MSMNQGVIVPIITPHILDDIFPVIDHLKSNGVKTIFLFGTTGESLYIPHETKIQLIKSVTKYLAKDTHSPMQLLVGISSDTIFKTLDLMRLAHECGAYASVISPLMIDHDALFVVHTLLQNAPGNLVLYNFPAMTNDLFIDIREVSALVLENRILGIKDSSGDKDYFNSLLKTRENHPDFKIYSGPEHNLPETLKLNIDGFVPSTGNVCPDLACRIWAEKENGPWTEWLGVKEQIKNQNPNYILAIKQLLKAKNIIRDEQLFSRRSYMT